MATGRKKPRRAISRTELALRSPVWAANKAAPMQQDKAATLVVDARMALHRIAHGDCRDEDPDELAMAGNVAMILAEWGWGEEYLPQIQDAQHALVAAQERANRGATFALDGPGMQAVRVMLEVFEQHLAVCGHREIMRALATAADRIRRGHVLGTHWAAGHAPSER